MSIFTTKGGQVYQLHQLTATVNLYDAPTGDRLATQGAAGRFLWVSALESERTYVQLAEDDYWGWLDQGDYRHLTPATEPYQPIARDRAYIEAVLEDVIAFCLAAQEAPHEYLWGGTVAPNYDCSGLMQASFASQGIWLPRDAYQQEAFATPLGSNSIAETLPQLQRGDLVFFGSREKATHVGLYLGQGQYIHSSGKEYGRNGIGIDTLFPSEDPVSIAYQRQFRGGGRIEYSYLPLTPHP
ncbi:C40 family peptidase [Thermosynechococcus vestitus]|uniref:Tlr2189 protein n=1 Tax=Thermosynechococcus vestitus (strain NIES-2133 / IAM M-273 / BP-1) TaxID=197221 RepID=Q8DGX3_THEVB|nr:C40 family peptidase [Thermosynechococcus vestitus]BAC09741.1 tlr2189 [Thermosynechococcus vestitus BP-1]